MALRPSRRWLRFSLRTLLVLVLVLGAFLGWLGQQANLVHKRKAAIRDLTVAGALIELCQHPVRYRRWLGDQYVYSAMLREADALRIGKDKLDRVQPLFPEVEIEVAIHLNTFARFSDGWPASYRDRILRRYFDRDPLTYSEWWKYGQHGHLTRDAK